MGILFIRHGQTTGDVENRYGGAYDDHLSPEGKKQTAMLIEELKDKNIDIIISSPLIRAQESAVIISRGVYPIIIEPNFRERNQYGILSGQIKSEAKRQYPNLVEKLADRLNTIDGAERYEDFSNRVQTAFNRLELNFRHQSLAVIWHGGPMRALFRDILKKGELDKEIGDCAWVELEKTNGQFVIKDSRRIKFLF